MTPIRPWCCFHSLRTPITITAQLQPALEYATSDRDRVVAALISLLEDEDRIVRHTSLAVLGRMPHDPATVVPALTHLLADTDLRENAARGLGRFGLDAASAAPRLCK